MPQVEDCQHRNSHISSAIPAYQRPQQYFIAYRMLVMAYVYHYRMSDINH